MKVTDAVTKDIIRETKAIKLHDRLITILAKFEGKKITKHLETEARKHFPSARLTRLAGMTYLEIDTNSADYSKYLLSYDGIYTEANFRKQNAWSGSAALERIAKNREWVSFHASKIEEKLSTIKQLLQELKDESLEFDSYNCPSFYSILREHELEDLKKVM